MIRLKSDGLAVALLFTAIGVLACFAPAQSDTWWLLRAGRDILRDQAIPFSDTYSYTAAGRYWWNHEWLAEVLFYGLYWLGRLPVVAASASALILVTWTILWRMTRGSFELRFVTVTSALIASAGAWALRPQLLSMLCFTTICWCLADDRRKWWVPVVVVIWINLHGAAVVSLAAVAGATAAATLFHRRIAWSYAGVLILTALATGCSPIGFHTYAEIAASVERSRINALIEWLPPDFRLANWPFWAMAAAVPATLVARRKTLDGRTARLLGMAVALLPLAVRSTRNVHLFVVAAVPALTSAWAARFPASTRVPRGERERVNGGLAVAGAVMGLAIVIAVWLHPPPPLGWRPIAPGAIDAINSCPAPIYNTYGAGGFLIWFTPSQKVFIDNRQDPYSDEVLRVNNQLEMTGEYEAVFARYGIKCAALFPDTEVTRRLEGDAAWKVAYRDRQWVVFRRATDR